MATEMVEKPTPEQQAVLDKVFASRPELKRPVSWQGTAAVVATLLTLSPIALGVGFLAARAIAIKNRPDEQSKEAHHRLGAWPRLLIVVSFFWSAIISTALFFLFDKLWTKADLIQVACLALAPLVLLWLIYFSAKWIMQGAER